MALQSVGDVNSLPFRLSQDALETILAELEDAKPSDPWTSLQAEFSVLGLKTVSTSLIVPEHPFLQRHLLEHSFRFRVCALGAIWNGELLSK